MRSSTSSRKFNPQLSVVYTYPDKTKQLQTINLVPYCYERAVGNFEVSAITLVKLIGDGFCGSVYLVKVNDEEKANFVLKISNAGSGTSKEFNLLLDEQASMVELGELASDVLVPKVTDSNQSPRGYLLMQYKPRVELYSLACDYTVDEMGVRISDFIKRPITIFEYCQLFIEICEALNEKFFKKGWAHRDIKLENIMVDYEEDEGGRLIFKVFFIDFGFAIKFNSMDKRMVGTVAYLAPEFVAYHAFFPRNQGEKATPSSPHIQLLERNSSKLGANIPDLGVRTKKSEVYAVGVVLLELLSGEAVRADLNELSDFFHSPNSTWVVNVDNHLKASVLNSIISNSSALLLDEDIFFIDVTMENILRLMLHVDQSSRLDIDEAIGAWKRLAQAYGYMDESILQQFNKACDAKLSQLRSQVAGASDDLSKLNFLILALQYLQAQNYQEVFVWIKSKELLTELNFDDRIMTPFLEELYEQQSSYLYPLQRVQHLISYCQQQAVEQLKQEITNDTYKNSGIAKWENILLFMSAIFVVPIIYVLYRVLGPGLFAKTPDGISDIQKHLQANNDEVDFATVKDILAKRGGCGLLSPRSCQTQMLYDSFTSFPAKAA